MRLLKTSLHLIYNNTKPKINSLLFEDEPICFKWSSFRTFFRKWTKHLFSFEVNTNLLRIWKWNALSMYCYLWNQLFILKHYNRLDFSYSFQTHFSSVISREVSKAEGKQIKDKQIMHPSKHSLPWWRDRHSVIAADHVISSQTDKYLCLMTKNGWEHNSEFRDSEYSKWSFTDPKGEREADRVAFCGRIQVPLCTICTEMPWGVKMPWLDYREFRWNGWENSRRQEW